MSNPYFQSIKDYQNSLAIDYMPAVKSMAFRLKERLPDSIDFNDLLSIGYEELVKLSRRYDPKKNSNFWGYAKKRIYGAMLDFLRSLDSLSRNDRKLIKEIDKIIEDYVARYDKEPTDEYLSEILNVDLKKIKKARLSNEIYSLLPIEEQLSYYEDISKGPFLILRPNNYETAVDWENEAYPLEDRARAYMAINCGHCHMPSGVANSTGLYLDFHETRPVHLGINKSPVAAGRGSGNLKYSIVPGHAEESILLFRMISTDPGVMMPEQGRSLVHWEAVNLIREWINSMDKEL